MCQQFWIQYQQIMIKLMIKLFNCRRKEVLFLCYPVHLFILVDYIWWVWCDRCDLYKYDGSPGHHVSPEIEMQTSVSRIIAICVLSTVLFIWGNLAIKLVTNLLCVLYHSLLRYWAIQQLKSPKKTALHERNIFYVQLMCQHTTQVCLKESR